MFKAWKPRFRKAGPVAQRPRENDGCPQEVNSGEAGERLKGGLKGTRPWREAVGPGVSLLPSRLAWRQARSPTAVAGFLCAIQSMLGHRPAAACLA